MPLQHFYDQIDGWFNFREIYEQAVRDAPDPAVFVEVGSWYGRSAAFMAVEIANSGKRIDFYCADTWKGSFDTPWMGRHLAGNGGSAFTRFRENLQRGGVWDRVRPIEQPSVRAAAQFADASVDFVMIDGSHDFQSVRDDVQAWLPKLRPGGTMAGDDANWPGVLIGVHESIAKTDLTLLNNGANWLYHKRRPARGTWSAGGAWGQSASDYVVVIPFVNRVDLLKKAVFSIRELWPALIVFDQSDNGLNLADHPWLAEIAGVFRTPGRSLSFTEVMNWTQAEARERGAEFLVMMHNDAECLNQVAPRVLDFARSRPRAGVVFTRYDALAVFRVRALDEVGPWDETFRWYFADNDYYRRMKLRGWECADFGGEEVIHHGSQTLHANKKIAAEVAGQWRWHQDHYKHKWGGPPGNETLSIPYKGTPW